MEKSDTEWKFDSNDYDDYTDGYIINLNNISRFIFDNIAAIRKILLIENQSNSCDESICLKFKIDAEEWSFEGSSLDEDGEYFYQQDEIHEFISDNSTKLKQVLTIETDPVKIAELIKTDRRNAAFNPHLTSEQIDQLLNDPDRDVVCNIALHPKLTSDQVDNLIAGGCDIRESVAKRDNLNADQISRLVNDGSSYVRSQIAENQNLTFEQVNQLVKDNDVCVRVTASYHPKYRVMW